MTDGSGGPSEPRLIADPEKVDSRWLTEVLRHSGAVQNPVRVVGFDAEQIGTGQVGCNVRYRLTYDRECTGPPSVVAKFASRDESSRSAGVQTLTYETEVWFYSDIAPTVDVSRPHCHFAAVEAGTPNVVLVLEDMEPAEQGDQLTGCTKIEADLAVTEAARLHGPRWGDAALLDIPLLADKMSSTPAMVSAFALFWPPFHQRYGELLSEQSVEVGTRMASSQGGWLAGEYDCLTVCHADYRLDNMLFAQPGHPRPLTIVDWQTARLGVGTSDISYFMGAAMHPTSRRECEEAFVSRYHEALGHYGVSAYSLDQCWDDYRRYSFGGFFMAVFASMVVQRTDRGDAMFMTMANGAAAQAVDLDAFEFLSSS